VGNVGNRSQIAPEIPQLLPNPLSKFLSPRLSGFGNTQIGSSGVLSIGAWLLLGSGATGMHVINELFRLLAGVIQKVQIGGVLDVGGYAGGIKEELTFWCWGLAFLLFVHWLLYPVICCRLSVGNQSGNGLVDSP